MTRFRARPREVEAVQWFKHGDHPSIKIVQWMATPRCDVLLCQDGSR